MSVSWSLVRVAGGLLLLGACDGRSDFEKEQDRLAQEAAEIRSKALGDAIAQMDRQDAEWEKSKGPAPLGDKACAASIGILMSQDPRIMTARKLEPNRFAVRYKRDDGTKWEFHCDVTTNRVRWHGFEGGQENRQRSEDNIRYVVHGKVLTITVRGIDGKDYDYRFQFPSLRRLT